MIPSVLIDSIDIETIEDTAQGARRRSFVQGLTVARGTVYTDAGAFEFSTPLTPEEKCLPHDEMLTALGARIVAAFK
jgi:hypothetical protein